MTLEQIEGRVWEEPRVSSSLISTCHRLRKKALVTFEPEDFRVLIGQQMSLELLVPKAIDLVVKEPMIEAQFYPGDLLCVLLEVKGEYWGRHEELRLRLEKCLTQAAEEMSKNSYGKIVEKCVAESAGVFRAGA